MPVIVDRKNGSPARTLLYFIMAGASLIGAAIFGGNFLTENTSNSERDLQGNPIVQNSSDATVAFVLVVAGILFLLMALVRIFASED